MWSIFVTDKSAINESFSANLSPIDRDYVILCRAMLNVLTQTETAEQKCDYWRLCV